MGRNDDREVGGPLGLGDAGRAVAAAADQVAALVVEIRLRGLNIETQIATPLGVVTLINRLRLGEPH